MNFGECKHSVHNNVESKIVKLLEAGSRMVVARHMEAGRYGEMQIKGYKVSVILYNFYCNEN